MKYFVIALVVIGALGVVMMIFIAASGRFTETTSARALVREHYRLTSKAAYHSRKGHEGEANIYTEAAERLLETIERKKL